MKNVIYFVSLTLFLVACNNLPNATPMVAVSPTLTTTPTPSPAIVPAVETEPVPTVIPPLPEEISQGIPFTLAQPFRVTPDEVKLVNVEPVTWLDSCLGIARRQPCLPGESSGYRLTVDIKGQSYVFHAPEADPLNLRLATGPVVAIENPALLWEGEPALFGGAEEGSCLSLSLTAEGQGALGVCDGPQRAVALIEGQFAQPQLWQDWLTRFAPFEADTPHGRVVFQGQGAETAPPAWQRTLAAWAKLAALELNDGRSGASWGVVLAWQQPLSDRPGYCQFLSVQSYGWAYTSTARCEGGDPQNLGQGWIDTAQWEEFDDWFYNRAPLTTDRLSFFGVGSRAMREDDKAALSQWAETLYDTLSEVSSIAVPATISQIHGSQGTLTLYPLPQPDGYIRALAIDRAGRVWVASALNLQVLEPETQTWTVFSLSDNMPGGVTSLLVDEQGQLWAGSGSGVSLFAGERWMLYDSAAGLTGGQVLALAADSNGDIWAGTDQGLSRFDGQSWHAIRGAPVPALSLAVDQAGRLWVGSAGGVHMLDSSTWTAYPYAGDFALMYVNAIAPDPAGNIWVASGACFLAPGDCTNTGLSKFDGQNWTNYLQTYFRNFSGIGPILAVNFDQTGLGWVGANAQFMKFNPQTLPPGAREDNPAWTIYPESFEQTGQVHAIVVDRIGNVWVGGFQGIMQLEILPLTTLTTSNSQTYTDIELDFSLNYDPTWRLETRTGTDLNDGSGRTILLEKEGYQFKLQLQRTPDVVGECGDILTETDLSRYWKYPLGQLEVWRAKAEAGWVNSFHHDQVSFIDIIVPTELRNEADAKGEIGMFSCSPHINDYVINISYQLPVSVEDLKAGRFNSERLAEMDYILTSLVWK